MSRAKSAAVVIVGGAASAFGGLLAQLSEVELSVAGVAGVLVTLAVRFRQQDPGQNGEKESRVSPPFERLRDLDVADRNDAQTFPEYRTIFAESQRRWASGDLATDVDRATAKNNALDFMLNAEARRASHAEKARITFVIVKDDGRDFVVKRVAPPSFGNGIRPGMHCPHNAALATLVRRYAPHHYDAEFAACDETYHLVALAQQPLSETAIGIVEQAATLYQTHYTYFRMAGIATPPPFPEATSEA